MERAHILTVTRLHTHTECAHIHTYCDTLTHTWNARIYTLTVTHTHTHTHTHTVTHTPQTHTLHTEPTPVQTIKKSPHDREEIDMLPRPASAH